ncbi:MFS transporter [Paenibacillus spongiae]|uniref:MFS transporter n=1 Tax=Paenibacillus spongiae TaxID=2909671 RepID=A0ABY5SD15_9BACL|nr:MFS transporter [Paenibacillus spongiae]UVI31832.1 MFS transporter [Paenibacillus spongiae]
MAGRSINMSRLKLQLDPTARHNYRIDAIASVLFSMFNVVFNQFYIPMAIREGATNLQVGLLAAAPAIGLLFSPLWAAQIERSNPKPYMIIPNLIGRALILLPAFFGVPLVYVAAALVFQILMGIQAPAYAAMITRVYPAKHRGKLMANVRIMMGALMIPMAFLVGSWMDVSGPSGPLMVASITGVISILVFSKLREGGGTEPVPAPAAKRASLREQMTVIKQNRELGIFLLATFFSGFGNILANPLYQIIQVDRLQLSNLEIGYARATYYACLLISYFVIGWVIDRFSAKHTMVYGIAAFAVVPMLYAFFGNYSAVLVGSGIQGIGDAIWDIGILAYVFRLAPGREAVVFGLHLMLFGIRGTIAPILSTVLVDSVSLTVLLTSASIIGWIGVLVFVLGGRAGSRSGLLEPR